ncbi:MAG: hypothetical protein IKQ92_05225 [Clostridia bacterium]|nr:hypothetical protein [Clostridia bacterium]
MAVITIDRTKAAGEIKRMNCVNNGPPFPGVRLSPTFFDAYRDAVIPYARNHDASFFTGYGGEHIVDVHRIFKNFAADENDPASYIFEPTDAYVENTYRAGTKVFYRLGASIEHDYKYGTRVPPDAAKWARICEHIIRHYNEGWANGFHFGIEYWEIWNEPDCRNADGSNPCWQGTEEEFIELYRVTSRHLKSCFPDLKIGGPAFCSSDPIPFRRDFLDTVAAQGLPLDFYSYHWYGSTPESFRDCVRTARRELDRRGLTKTETVLNEWNYIRGWSGDLWLYSLETEKNLKGSSFIAAVLATAQANPLDMLMYCDARPCGMNGLFGAKGRGFECLKGYYPFAAFRDLRALGTWIPTDDGDGEIYSCAATDMDGKAAAVMVTYYADDEENERPEKEIGLRFEGFPKDCEAEVRVLDGEDDLRLTSTQRFAADSFTVWLRLKLYTTAEVKITPRCPDVDREK